MGGLNVYLCRYPSHCLLDFIQLVQIGRSSPHFIRLFRQVKQPVFVLFRCLWPVLAWLWELESSGPPKLNPEDGSWATKWEAASPTLSVIFTFLRHFPYSYPATRVGGTGVLWSMSHFALLPLKSSVGYVSQLIQRNSRKEVS